MEDNPRPYRTFRVKIQEFDGKQYGCEFNWSPKFIDMLPLKELRKEFDKYVTDTADQFFAELTKHRNKIH